MRDSLLLVVNLHDFILILFFFYFFFFNRATYTAWVPFQYVKEIRFFSSPSPHFPPVILTLFPLLSSISLSLSFSTSSSFLLLSLSLSPFSFSLPLRAATPGATINDVILSAFIVSIRKYCEKQGQPLNSNSFMRLIDSLNLYLFHLISF